MDPDGSAATSSRPRGRAREARENDTTVLEAARAVFAEHGDGAPMSAIADRAGVGVASIYRRYPSKDLLVRALRLLALQQATDLAVDATAAEPGAAVRGFLERHIRQAPGLLLTTFGQQLGLGPEVDASADRLRLALDALVARDAGTGALPADYTAAELMSALTHLRPALPTSRDRRVEIHLRQLDAYLAGLRAAAADPSILRGEPMQWSEWLALNSAG
ncbi:TetR/AcrR family transcriptional regulator [Agromyces sp. MMS24-K17]|uniref:TetR/AcrR family transcriptional regulator n=1 Tax=Agromyces sp. MMS24-K17 TaxID=3372850 RepID=UPI00375536D3